MITFILKGKLDLNKYFNLSLMRELNTTVQHNQANQADTIGTWVGFPHNMLVPRYFRYIHYLLELHIDKQQ